MSAPRRDLGKLILEALAFDAEQSLRLTDEPALLSYLRICIASAYPEIAAAITDAQGRILRAQSLRLHSGTGTPAKVTE